MRPPEPNLPKEKEEKEGKAPNEPTWITCEGGEGSLGHPVIYLDLTKTGKATCPYCSRVFDHS